jgi:magnesium chelatase family protein
MPDYDSVKKHKHKLGRQTTTRNIGGKQVMSTITSAAVQGTTGYPVVIDIQTGFGMVNFYIEGLPEGAARESGSRIRSALVGNGYEWRSGSSAVVSPPGGKGSALDLPMALGVLVGHEQIQIDDQVLSSCVILGELGFRGEVRGVRGVFPMVCAAAAGFEFVMVPRANAEEAVFAARDQIKVLPVESLKGAVAHLTGESQILPAPTSLLPKGAVPGSWPSAGLDMEDVRGQAEARRALEIAAAGGHNIALVGPSGSGKTMMARRLPTILPDMTDEERREVTAIYSVSGLLPRDGVIANRPFRAPHHTISDVAMVGGGVPIPRPGELSLAHTGVLFLDEYPEFRHHVLGQLPRPVKEGSIQITRRAATVTYPAKAHVVASANACFCGYLGSRKRACRCTKELIERYRSRYEGSLDKIVQMRVEMADMRHSDLVKAEVGESSEAIRERVVRARKRQARRLGEGRTNASMTYAEGIERCVLNRTAEELLASLEGANGAYFARDVLRIAQTIADLSESENIEATRILWVHHIEEALGYIPGGTRTGAEKT